MTTPNVHMAEHVETHKVINSDSLGVRAHPLNDFQRRTLLPDPIYQLAKKNTKGVIFELDPLDGKLTVFGFLVLFLNQISVPIESAAGPI